MTYALLLIARRFAEALDGGGRVYEYASDWSGSHVLSAAALFVRARRAGGSPPPITSHRRVTPRGINRRTNRCTGRVRHIAASADFRPPPPTNGFVSKILFPRVHPPHPSLPRSWKKNNPATAGRRTWPPAARPFSAVRTALPRLSDDWRRSRPVVVHAYALSRRSRKQRRPPTSLTHPSHCHTNAHQTIVPIRPISSVYDVTSTLHKWPPHPSVRTRLSVYVLPSFFIPENFRRHASAVTARPVGGFGHGRRYACTLITGRGTTCTVIGKRRDVFRRHRLRSIRFFVSLIDRYGFVSYHIQLFGYMQRFSRVRSRRTSIFVGAYGIDSRSGILVPLTNWPFFDLRNSSPKSPRRRRSFYSKHSWNERVRGRQIRGSIISGG